MAWIRRVRTASGATAVQVADYVNGRRRIVAHVGSAHTEAELGLLMQQAQKLLEGSGQAAFKLGITPSPRKADLIGPADSDDVALFARQEASDRAGGRVVAPARVVTTGSDVLFQALAGVFTDLGLAPVTDAVFASMVIARIVEPTSILDLGRVLSDLGQSPASEKTFRRTLQRCHGGGWREKFALACFAHAQRAGDVSLCL